MRKTFRVLSGRHIENKDVYNKGGTFESEKDLCKLYPNKFEDLGRVKGKKADGIPSKNGSKKQNLPPTKVEAEKVEKPSEKGDDWEDDDG